MDFENKINYLTEEFKKTDILNIKSSNEFLYKIMNEVHSLISIYIKFDENKIRKKCIDLIDKTPIESKEIKDKMKNNFIESFKSKKGGAAKDATNHLIPTVNEHINEGPLQNINNINEDPTIDINVTFLERLLKEANEERIQNAERQRRLAVQEEHSLTFLLFIFCILDWENRLNFSIIAFVCNLNINFNYSDRRNMTWDHSLMNQLWITYIKIILNMFVFFDLIWFIASVSHIVTYIDNRIVAMTPANTISYEYDIDYNSHLLALELISHYDVPNQDIINGYDLQLDNLSGPNNLVLDYFRSSDPEDQFGNINRAYNILGFNDFFTIAINRFQHLINQNNNRLMNNELMMNQQSILNTIYYLSAISVYLLFYNILRLRERINRNNRNNRNGGSSLKKKSVKKKSVKKKSVKKKSVKKIR